eukprot:TRINITY_DN15868_c0_g1_i1.p1 TRINITY_DN15868_c0_g1~~TRINITY_DN15868_c0_g1_i1.p1  ORF type:complete len:332 (-),score=40.49 TRINITY_DN15868_c0_g1_i1:39-944(-)
MARGASDEKTQFTDSQLVRNPGLAIEQLFSVRGKVALITGGTRGIGLMIAKAYVENGAKVYISARKADVCDRVAADLTRLGLCTCVSLPADLTSDKACRDLASKIGETEEKLNILVNNAGATWGSSFDEFPDHAWNKIMTLNVASIFNLSRACFPLLKRGSGGSMDPSNVINIGSVSGHPSESVFDNAPSYSASKAVVAQVSRFWAAKFCRDGVNVNCVQPAVFPSKMTSDYQLKSEGSQEMTKLMHSMGRYGHENDMAGLVLFLSSRASAFVTAETICLDGGMAHITGADKLPLGVSAKL